MTNEEIALRIQAGERNLIDVLWEQNTGLFMNKSYSLYTRNQHRCVLCGVEIEDIIQVCFLALLDAVRAFLPETGYKLMAYFKFPLLNHFSTLVGIRSVKRDALNYSASLNETFGEDKVKERIEALADADSMTPYEAVDDDIFRSQLHNALEHAISNLSDNRAFTIRKRYFERKTLTQIAAEMGLTHQRISQLERKAIEKLKCDRNLQAFNDEIIAHWAYKGTGLRSFMRSRISSVERVVFLIEDVIYERGDNDSQGDDA